MHTALRTLILLLHVPLLLGSVASYAAGLPPLKAFAPPIEDPWKDPAAAEAMRWTMGPSPRDVRPTPMQKPFTPAVGPQTGMEVENYYKKWMMAHSVQKDFKDNVAPGQTYGQPGTMQFIPGGGSATLPPR